MEEALPLHLPEWESWRKQILRRIEAGSAADDLQSLVEDDCDKEALLFRLAGLAAAWGRTTPPLSAVGLTRHTAKATPKKLREVADILDRLRQLAFFLRPEQSEAADLTKLLRRFADRLEKDLSLLLRPSHTTVGVAALCGLIGYVRRTTGKYHDQELAALVGAVLGKDGYAATNLTQWRWKHKRELEQLKGCIVSPYSIPVERT